MNTANAISEIIRKSVVLFAAGLIIYLFFERRFDKPVCRGIHLPMGTLSTHIHNLLINATDSERVYISCVHDTVKGFRTTYNVDTLPLQRTGPSGRLWSYYDGKGDTIFMGPNERPITKPVEALRFLIDSLGYHRVGECTKYSKFQ